jgi:DNA-binding transcriptional LysR family regulator
MDAAGGKMRMLASVGDFPPVELRELQVFLTITEELRFARAAERLQINPSRVSQIISTLEAKLGGRLFDRTSRRVRLTPLAEQVASELLGPYRELQDVLIRARELATGIAGQLRIGMYAISAGPHMAEIARTFNARYPSCEAKFINVGYERSYIDVLRAGEVEMLASRLPLTDPHITVGPILSREERVVIIAKQDPLAQRKSISYEELAGRVISDVPSFPREMIDAFHPARTPSGRALKRVAHRGAEELMMQVALGQMVHPTVPSFLDHYSNPGVTSVPIRDLPPSETALVWLKANRSAKIQAFARTAADVLAHTEPGTHQPGYQAGTGNASAVIVSGRSIGAAT